MKIKRKGRQQFPLSCLYRVVMKMEKLEAGIGGIPSMSMGQRTFQQ
jgi:hypothetical protein